jgi:Fe-Mn family superoxide dismutase
MHSEISKGLSRREALKTLGAGAAILGLGGLSLRSAGAETTSSAAASTPAGKTSQPFSLPKLEYDYGALEPHIDRQTMEIHHTKHHQAYITNANKALADHPELKAKSAEELLQALSSVPEKIRTTVRNNVGGHLNHSFFWKVIGPQAGGEPVGELADAIVKAFGSFDAFKALFAAAGMGRFGSGWAWLSLQNGALKVHSTANQDSPLLDGAVPLLGVDVWEHAYYLHYQNRRAEYLTAFWNVVNWSQVTQNFRANKPA